MKIISLNIIIKKCSCPKRNKVQNFLHFDELMVSITYFSKKRALIKRIGYPIIPLRNVTIPTSRFLKITGLPASSYEIFKKKHFP